MRKKAVALRDRGTGMLFKRPKSPYWHCQFYAHGLPVRMSTKETDDKRAEKFLRKKIGEVLADVFKDPRRLRYEEMRKAYMADYVTNERKSLRTGKDGKVYLDKVNRLDGFFRNWLASEINTDALQAYIADQKKKGLSPGTINRSLAALKHMFHLAKDAEKLTRIPKFDMLAESAPRKGVFEREDYAALYQVLPAHLKLPVAIGWYTGARLGEILGLTWEFVDDDHGYTDLKKGIIHLLKTKNGDPRDLPIIGPLGLLLKAREAQRKDFAFVCFRLNERDERERIQSFRKAWNHACCQAGLGQMHPVLDAEGEMQYQKLRGPRSKRKPKLMYTGRIFHDLRRSAICNMLECGISQVQAMRFSGHETASVFKRYASIFNQRSMQAAAQKLENFHNQPLGATSVLPVPEIADEDLPVN
jgi:integrase